MYHRLGFMLTLKGTVVLIYQSLLPKLSVSKDWKTYPYNNKHSDMERLHNYYYGFVHHT